MYRVTYVADLYHASSCVVALEAGVGASLGEVEEVYHHQLQGDPGVLHQDPQRSLYEV